MTRILIKTSITALILAIAACTGLLTAQAYAAERALWVWSMAEKIVLDDPAGSRAEFFNFCDAPHGDSAKKITIVYLSSTSLSKDLISSYPEAVRGFLAAAHSRGLKVECLDGSKQWATPPGLNDDPPGWKAGVKRLDIILNFNKAGASDAERFDGIHYDVEPHGLHSSKGDSYDWDADNAVIWTQYLTLLTNCQAKVNAYNASYTPIKFGADIAYWYDADSYAGTPNDVQTRVDYVTLMDYRQTGVLIADGAATELANGNTLGKKVYVGVETAPAVPPDPTTITFFEEGNAEMETQLTDAFDRIGANASFSGFAIHYYEDISAGEWAYRKLWTDAFPGYPPAVQVVFPNGDEGITLKQGVAYDIKWTAVDKDDNAADLKITIAYSANGGGAWTNIATNEANDGVYAWNTAGLANGTQCRVKVTAVDPGGLSQYDVSDYNFAFSSEAAPIPDWGGGVNTGINGVRPILIPEGNNLHMAWYWPGWGPESPYAIYYKKSADKGATWGSVITLAEDTGGADGTIQPRKPALAVRGNTLAAVWLEGTGALGAKKVKVKTSADGGGTWTSAVEIQGNYASYKWADFPAIAINSTNNIYVVWGARYTGGDQQWEIHYNSKAAGGSWAGRITISDVTAAHVRATPAITIANGVHVVWGEFSWSDLTYKIKYRRRAGGSWSAVKQLHQRTVVNVEWAKKYFPRISADSSVSNKLHVVWQYAVDSPETGSASDSDVYYSSSSDGGNTWRASPVNLADGFCPAVSESGGDLYVIYYQPSAIAAKGNIRYRKSTNAGTSWLSEAVLTNDANTPYFAYDVDLYSMVGVPNLAADSGNIVSAWRAYSTERIMFSYRGEYGSPTNLFANLVYSSSNSIKLKWDKPSGHTPNSYSLYRSQNGGAYSLATSGIYDVEYKDTGLSNTSYYKYKVAAVEDTTESRFSNISNALYPGDIFLLDYMEGYEGINYSKAGTSALIYAYDTSDKQEGAKSMKLVYTYGGSGWGAALIGALPATFNLLDYWSVKFWAKGGAAGKTAVAFQITETGHAEGNETWKSPATTITDAGWVEYQFNFSDFTRTDVDVAGGGNFKIDGNSIGSYGMVFDSNKTADGTYYVDGIKLLRREGFISVAPGPEPDGSYTFGTVTGSIADHRFILGPIPVTFGGFSENWTVRIWTNNNPMASQIDAPKYAGLKGVDVVTYIPLKVWCVNFGPARRRPPPPPPLPDAPYPDEENDYFWRGNDFNRDGDKDDWYISGTFDESAWGFDINGNGNSTDVITASRAAKIGEEPFWLRVPEYNEMDPANKFTWRRLCYAPGGELSSPFNIYLAIDTADAAVAQKYQTTTLTLEYINE